MSKEPTKAELLDTIARLRELAKTPLPSPEERLIAALATLVSDWDHVSNVKHLFYRRDKETMQVSLDMHGDAP
jgi:hypothetical protein